MAFGVYVEPWPPISYKAIFLEEALCDGIFRKVCAVREANRLKDDVERVLLGWKHMLDSKA